MKLLPISIIALLILTSVVKRPDCDCAVQQTFYFKGKVVYRNHFDVWQSTTMVEKTREASFGTKVFTYDSLVTVPIRRKPSKFKLVLKKGP